MKRIKKCLAYLMVLIIGFNLFFYVCAKNVYPKIEDDYKIKASSGENVLKNDYLEVVVNKDGKFTIGTIEGNPEILTDNNKKLLYGHPDPGTSQTTIKIDEDVKILDENQNASFNLNGDSLEVIYNIDKIQVKQILSIVENTSTARKDVVEIKYEVKNTDTISHNIGTRIMLDTMLGDNDEAPFRIPGIGNVDREVEFSGDNIPEYWQAFDNLNNPSVVSQGSFLRNIENKPDKVQFINWGRVTSNPWNVKIYEGSLIGDSAVTVTWNEKELLAGETRNYVTYYGMSELVQDLTPPLSLSIYGDTVAKLTNDKYSYNDIVVSAYIKNIGNGLSSETYAEIILPEDISLVNGEKKISLNEIQVGEEKQVSWKLKIKPSLIEKTLTYSIKVYSDNAQEKIVSTNILAPSTKAKKAIIIIPGITGSELISKSTYMLNYGQINSGDNIWLPKFSFDSVIKIKPIIELLKCTENGESVYDVEEKNIKDNDNSFGTIGSYTELVQNLKKTYENSEYEVKFFSYDWRLTNEIAANKLNDFIENNNYNDVILVCHSMGGIVASKYIANRNENKVEKLITLGTPYLGAPKALYAFETGNFLDGKFAQFVTSKIIKDMIPNMPGVYELLPSKLYFSQNNDYYITVNSSIQNYDYGKNFFSSRSWCNKNLIDKSQIFQDSLGNISSNILNKVDSYIIVGYNVPTITLVKYENSKLDIDINSRGDGTVPIISSAIYGLKRAPYYVKDVDHSTLVKNPEVLSLINMIIDGKGDTYDESKINNITRNENSETPYRLPVKDYVKLTVACPVNLEVYDFYGNLIGKVSPEQISTKEGFENYFYSCGENNDKKIAFLPKGNYKIKLIGTGEGEMNYSIEKYNENKVVQTHTFSDVKITQNTIINTEINENSKIVLNVDNNNDGEVNKVINADEEFLLGDIDENKKINSFDALKILQISSRENITEEEKKVADINKDGKVNSLDALKVLQYATGKIDKLE